MDKPKLKTKLAFMLFGSTIREQMRYAIDDIMHSPYSKGICTAGCMTKRCKRAYHAKEVKAPQEESKPTRKEGMDGS